MSKVALITGITGQDGAYLAEFLLKKGYAVHGVKRRASSFNTDRIDHLYQDPHESNVRLKLHYGDLTDSTNLIRIIQEIQPDEIYNLAAQSHVAVSFETPEYTANSDAVGTSARLGSNPNFGAREKNAILPSLNIRDVRKSAGDSAKGNHAVLPPLALRRRKGLCILDYRELSRGLRHVCLQRHPVQPRIANARRNLRIAENHPRIDESQSWPAGKAASWKSRFAARLGSCPGLRQGSMADAAAGCRGGFCHRNGEAVFGT